MYDHDAVVFIVFFLLKDFFKYPVSRSGWFVCCEELQQATFAEALALVLMFLGQASGAATETTKELIRSLIDRFLKDLP